MNLRIRRKRSKSSILVFLLGLFLFSSCDQGKPDVSGLLRDVKVNRLDNQIYRSSSKDELYQVIDKNRDQMNLFYGLSQLPSDTILADLLWHRIEDPAIDTFYGFYQENFEDLSWLEEQCKWMFGYINYYYPDFTPPQISTIFSAYLDKDMVLDTSHVVVSMDFFLGPEAKYTPRMPEYMARRYQRDYLVPMFFGLAISQYFNEVNSADRSLMAEMVYYGKAHLFVEMVMPDIPDSLYFGFSKSEREYVNENFETIWSYFVERDLLFTNNYSEINRYVGERPKTVEINPECPGRIGRLIGYYIVKSYLNSSSSLDLQAVMANPDAQEIFRESGFNPSRLPN